MPVVVSQDLHTIQRPQIAQKSNTLRPRTGRPQYRTSLQQSPAGRKRRQNQDTAEEPDTEGWLADPSAKNDRRTTRQVVKKMKEHTSTTPHDMTSDKYTTVGLCVKKK